MQLALTVALSLHVLATIFWAGTTFAVARMAGRGSAALFWPQMTAFLVALVSGAYLGHVLHEASFGQAEILLATGAASAVLAVGVQAIGVGPAIRHLRPDGAGPYARVAIAHRIAAGLLAFAAIAMAASKYGF